MRPLSDLIHRLLPLSEAALLSSVDEQWEKIAGKAAAAHCRPRFLVRRRLTVVCDSAAWLFEMSRKKEALLKSLCQSFGQEAIESVYFRQGEGDRNGKDTHSDRGR
jgi:predicted nucleic acid-binding Zn ribbon protein